MAVPIGGSYKMFTTSSGGAPTSETIAGAIKDGGGSVDGLTSFTSLIAASNKDLFDTTYAGTITATSDVSASLQYQNYPIITPAPTTPAPVGPPVTPAPITPAPVTPQPVSPVTPEPTPAPAEPTPPPTQPPVTPSPAEPTPPPTPQPVTPEPVTPEPVTPPPTPPPVTPPPVATCSLYNLGADGGTDVTFTYKLCGDSSDTNTFVTNGNYIQVCAQDGSITMSPNTGTIAYVSACPTPPPTPSPVTPAPTEPTPPPTPPPTPAPVEPTPVPVTPPPVVDNVFAVERGSDGFSTYVQYNGSYGVNDLVILSNDPTQCYEVMNTSYVVDPTIYGTITGTCTTPAPTPPPTPAPVVLNYACGGGNITQSTSAGQNNYGLYPVYSISSTDSAPNNTVYWTSYDRPNRFSLSDGSGAIWNSGWVGYANYSGPWGASLNTAQSGNSTFSWGNTSNREMRVEYGACENPGGTPCLNDAAVWSITCGTVTPSPTAATPPPTPAPTTPAPTTPAPSTPQPVSPTTPAPSTPQPVSPVTPQPVSPVTPAPTTPAPISTPSPVIATPAPTTPSPTISCSAIGGVGRSTNGASQACSSKTGTHYFNSGNFCSATVYYGTSSACSIYTTATYVSAGGSVRYWNGSSFGGCSGCP